MKLGAAAVFPAAMSFSSLPLGYRFRPTDQELIDFYLRNKINGHHHQVKVIGEVDICKSEPWDLPRLSVIPSDDGEWFFFSARDQKFPSSQRLNRSTKRGYWKATGKDRKIKNSLGELIGLKKTLVFYTGRAPTGNRTNWVMHEYRTVLKELFDQRAFVICRLFEKNDASVQHSHDDEIENVITSPASAAENLLVKSENEVEIDIFGSGLDDVPLEELCNNSDDDARSNLQMIVASDSTPIPVSYASCWDVQGDECLLQNETDGESKTLQHLTSDDSCHYMNNYENISTLQNNKNEFASEMEPEFSVEQFISELQGNSWTDDVPMASESTVYSGSSLLSKDDLNCDIQNYYNDILFECGDELYEGLWGSSVDEPFGLTNTSITSIDTGIKHRTREEINQLGASDVPNQGNAVRRIHLQQNIDSFYHCNHVRSHPTEAQSVISQEEIHLTNVKLTSSRVKSRKWPFMFASDEKSKRKPDEVHASVSMASYNFARKKLKIWTAFAAVLFAVFIGLPAVRLLGNTQMVLDWP